MHTADVRGVVVYLQETHKTLWDTLHAAADYAHTVGYDNIHVYDKDGDPVMFRESIRAVSPYGHRLESQAEAVLRAFRTIPKTAPRYVLVRWGTKDGTIRSSTYSNRRELNHACFATSFGALSFYDPTTDSLR